MFLPVRKHRHRNYYISSGLSLFLPVELKLNYDSNTIFWKISGWIITAKKATSLSFSLCFSILLFFLLSSRIARQQSTQCFPLNKPHVSSQKILCVISGGRREAQEKRGKVKCTQRYWRVTQREKKEEWKSVGSWGMTKRRETGKMERREKKAGR